MHVFYTPDIQTHAELPEEEAAHAVRVWKPFRKPPCGKVICTLPWHLPRTWTVQSGLPRKRRK